MKLHLLTTMTLGVLMTACLHGVAADIPLATEVEADRLVASVLAVDAAKHQVVLRGPEGRQVFIQLTDRAKDLGHLKVGDQVNIEVIHSVAAYLDTDIDKGSPQGSETIGDVRATKNNPTPEGEAFRQLRVQLKIVDINLKSNQLTFESPAGRSKVIDIQRPEIQAKLKELKVGQSVLVAYTDVLRVTSKH